MKSKKILTMFSSLVMAATLGATALAGCNKGGHQHAPNWTTDYEATCVAPGQRTGKCVCGHVIAEVIPINPDAHDYNDWEINEYPTESKEGKATRTCKLDASHVAEATLPVVTEAGTGYVSSPVTAKPTIISAGSRHFVYAHTAGNVEFDIQLPKRTAVETVEDAALLGSSLHDLIRESNGRYVTGDPDDPVYDQNSDKYDPTAKLFSSNFSNYYGDNYVRVHDDGNRRDFWYSRDENGKPFGISAEVQTVITNEPEDPDNPPEGWKAEYGEVKIDPRIDEGVSEQDLLGYGYESGGGMRRTYGAEDTLLTYYNASQSDTAIKYEDNFVKTSNNEYVCSFSFSRKEQTHFCRYTVNFTLYASGAIKTLSVRTKIIRAFMLANSFDGTNVGELIFDTDGDVIFGEIYPLDPETSEDLYEADYERNEDGSLKYEYTYLTDEEGKFVLDEHGDKVVATDEDGNEIKHLIVKSILVEGVKQKPDGTTLIDRFGNEIGRPVPQGWKEGDLRKYYYEKGDKKYDGTDDVYEADHSFIAIRVVEFNNTLKAEGEKVEANPYPPESVYIQSFDVTYGGKKIEDGEKIEVKANTNVIFNISNVQPAETAKLEFDPLRVFLKTKTTEIELSYTGEADFDQNAYHIVGNFNRSNNTVFFNAQYAGDDLSLILRTVSGKCEREIKMDIKKGNPTNLIPYVYTYSDANGTETHVWTECKEPVTLYVGQPLYVRATATSEEAKYVDDSFVTSVSNTYSSYFKLEDNIDGVDNAGKPITVSKITPLKVTTNSNGAKVYIDSTIMNGSTPVASTDIRIKVVEAPSVEGMFSGEYNGRFNYIKINENGALRPADVKVTVNPDVSDSTTGTFKVEVTDGSSTLTCIYNYTYNAETHVLTSEYVSGRNDETFQFEFALNEVYKLSIKHATYPTRSETIILSRPQN